jgi:4-carboxymuconolactone decarboxylase
MKVIYFAAAVASLSLIAVFPVFADDPPSQVQLSAPTVSDIAAVAPALERYTRVALFDGLWKRPELSPRDRSLITLAVLITRNQTALLPPY